MSLLHVTCYSWHKHSRIQFLRLIETVAQQFCCLFEKRVDNGKRCSRCMDVFKQAGNPQSTLQSLNTALKARPTSTHPWRPGPLDSTADQALLMGATQHSCRATLALVHTGTVLQVSACNTHTVDIEPYTQTIAQTRG